MPILSARTIAAALVLLANVASAAAQTPIPPPPSRPAPPAASGPVVSLVASVGLGGGSHRMGPFNALAQLDLDVRASRHWSFGARGGFLGAGEPDGRGADGHYAAGLLAYHAPLAIDREVFASLGVGWLRISGYDDSHGESAFDDDTLLVIARFGALFHASAFLAGASLDCFAAPDEGVSVVLIFLVGLGV